MVVALYMCKEAESVQSIFTFLSTILDQVSVDFYEKVLKNQMKII